MSLAASAVAGEQLWARSKRRAIGLGIIAVIVALGTGWAVFDAITAYDNELAARSTDLEGDLTVVAVVDLPAGTVLEAKHMRTGNSPAGTAASAALFHDIEPLIGVTLAAQTLTGETIRPERLVIPGVSALRIDQVLDPGMRAVTLRLDAEATIGSHLQPNHYVDVFITIPRQMPNGTTEWVTEVVLQGVRVVSVDDQVAAGPVNVTLKNLMSPDQLATRLVTVEASPTEAKALIHSKKRGEVHLALRGQDDLSVTKYGNPLVTSELVGVPISEQSQRLEKKREITNRSDQARRTKEVIEMLRGTTRSTFERVDVKEAE